MKAVAFTVPLLVTACATDATPEASTNVEALTSGQNAIQATNDFLDLYLYLPSYNLHDSHPADNVWAMPGDYWKYAQAYDAVLDAVERSQGAQFTIHARQLFTGWHDWPGQWKRTWFDDENWVALALLHAHRVEPEPNGDYLGLASMTYDDIWARGATHDRLGNFTGIYESISTGPNFHTKAAVSNFGPVITAVHLNHMTEAREIYAWAREHLSDPLTGNVYGDLEPDGTVVKVHYTYDFGVAIGAALSLYEATHEKQFRDDAYRYADFMVHNLVEPWNGEMILYDYCAPKCETEKCDCSTFKGIGYRYLAALYESQIGANDPAYATTIATMHDVLSASARALWSARSPSGTFPSDWGGGWRTFSSLGGEASAVMTLNIAAKDGF
jgi:predicted alpha-1,6-mannanase (GH76 family)